MSCTATCREVAEFLADYLEGDLPPDRRDEFERHLSGCACCGNYLESYRDTIKLCRASLCDGQPGERPIPPAPEPLVAAVVAALGRKPQGGCG